MSQLPSSNPPPPLPPGLDQFQHGPQLLAPARRAAIMLFILGSFAILGGLALAIVPWCVPVDQINRFIIDSKLDFPQPPPGFTIGEIFRIGWTILGGVSLVVGGIVLGLGLFVRKGRRWACITALVLCILAALYFAFSLLYTLMQAPGNLPRMIGGACVAVVPIGLLILTLAWLIQAIRMAPQLRLVQQQYQMQMWQYQQQPPPTSGTGWQSGYGMRPPPPPTA